MKKIFLTLGILIALTLLAITVTSCGEPSEEPVPLHVFMTDGESDFTVYYPLSANSNMEVAIDNLKSLCEENAASPFEFKSDFVATGTDMTTFNGAKEILLGDTNRLESEAVAASLRENDYVICIKDGKLIVIGGGEDATVKAINRFAAMFFSQPQDALILEETYVYEYHAEYAVDSLTLDGKAIYDYVICHDSETKKDALNLQQKLRDLTGYTLSLAEGETDASCVISVESASAEGCYASLSDGKLTLSGDTVANRSLAVSRFISALSAGGDIALDSSFSISGEVNKTNPISVFNLNLYSTGYAENSVNNRYPRLMKLVETYRPTVLCLQEVSPTWLDNMKNGVGSAAALTATYDYVGVGRNNDKNSVMNAIFYDKALYALKDSGTFWLSTTPDWESVGWDARTRCVCTWVILTEKASGKDFAVMNTALDPYGRSARVNGAKLIYQRAEAFGLPVIVAGDFQSLATNSVCTTFTNNTFHNTETVATTVGENGKTVNGAFGNLINSFSRASDFVFVSYGDFAVDSYRLIKDLVDDEYVSNHWPIYTTLYLVS